MSTSNQSLFDVTAKVGAHLQGLTPEEQQRVLDGVSSLLGFAGPQSRGDDPDTGRVDDTGQGSKKLSLVEFVKDKSPTTNPQRIAVFAAYREVVEGVAGFARNDLRPYFAKAKLKQPANYNRDYDGAVSAGWIHDDGGSSYLTQTGTEKVQAAFSRSSGTNRSAKPKAQRNAKGNGR